ncbi:MAG: glycoside hydrolase family 97 N-terminal domain-containing protein, partial [Rhodospirillaceae bacterium]|nr:glycoside hydrolase family 97 N-terminal domain-containing protein [Rhodospirillaceae bacterium]
MVKTGFSVLTLAVCANVSAAPAVDVADLGSPDRHIRVAVQTGEGGCLQYTVTRDGKPVLLASQLGLQLEGAELSSGLTVVARSAPRPIREHYDMAVGKRRSISYRVADAALARKKLLQERTSFALPASSRAWLQPMSVAQTGWNGTNPSYEEHYQMDIAAGSASPSPAGWVFPALFKVGDNWL